MMNYEHNWVLPPDATKLLLDHLDIECDSNSWDGSLADQIWRFKEKGTENWQYRKGGLPYKPDAKMTWGQKMSAAVGVLSDLMTEDPARWPGTSAEVEYEFCDTRLMTGRIVTAETGWVQVRLRFRAKLVTFVDTSA